MNPKLSVIICTHNPRHDYLNRVLTSLKEQTYSVNDWELLVIDNASDTPVENWLDVNWHPTARIVGELDIGLTHARIRGINETKAPILVFVDDDNVLPPEYLVNVLHAFDEFPLLGVAGPGVSLPEYEAPPPPEIGDLCSLLILHHYKIDHWRTDIKKHSPLPAGAAMSLRREIAVRYVDLLMNSPLRIGLGRSGNSLLGGEDLDIGMTALSMGYHTAILIKLSITHLMPSRRLDVYYINQLTRASAFSNVMVRYIWGMETRVNYPKIILWLKFYMSAQFTWNGFNKARLIGTWEALSQIKNKHVRN